MDTPLLNFIEFSPSAGSMGDNGRDVSGWKGRTDVCVCVLGGEAEGDDLGWDQQGRMWRRGGEERETGLLEGERGHCGPGHGHATHVCAAGVV